MFGIFKKKSEKEKLMQKYKALLQEAYKLSHTDRKAADLKTAEAEEIFQKAEKLP